MTPLKILSVAAAVAALTGCVVVVPAGGGVGRGDVSAVQIAPASVDGFEAEALQRINAQRRAGGLRPVRQNAQLQAAAESHSRWMARTGTMSHTGAGGTDMVARMRAAGYKACDANENVAFGQRTPARVVKGWVESRGHNVNIMERGMDHGAVAAVRDANGTIWWTMVLGERC